MPLRRSWGLVALVALMTGCSGEGTKEDGTSAIAAQSRPTATVARHRAGETTSTRATPTTIRVVSGATGPTGSPGPPGAPGSPGVSGFEIVRSSKARAFDWNATDQVPLLEHSVSCPPGKTVISGGASVALVPPNGDSFVAAY